MLKPCITDTRRVWRDGTFRWNHRTYRATSLPVVTSRWERYGIGMRDDGSVYLRRGQQFISDTVELCDSALPSVTTHSPTTDLVIIPRSLKVPIL